MTVMIKSIISMAVLSCMALVGCGEFTSSQLEKGEIIMSQDVLETMQIVSDTEQSEKSIKIQVGDEVFTANLYENSTTTEFLELLPMTLDMSELNGNEKYYFFNTDLASNPEQVGDIKNGDIMLYGSDCLVLFCENFSTSYHYTKLGTIENPSELKRALGDGMVRVTYSLD